jgi:hypothetical protein
MRYSWSFVTKNKPIVSDDFGTHYPRIDTDSPGDHGGYVAARDTQKHTVDIISRIGGVAHSVVSQRHAEITVIT